MGPILQLEIAKVNLEFGPAGGFKPEFLIPGFGKGVTGVEEEVETSEIIFPGGFNHLLEESGGDTLTAIGFLDLEGIDEEEVALVVRVKPTKYPS
jgi:hypothetical protein